MASEMASSILPSRARLRRSCGFPYQFRPLTSDVRICGRPVHLPPALCSAPFVNQTIHVFYLDAQLLCLTVSVLHELLPPAVARLCLLTDFKQRAQKLVRELVSGLALFLGELADLLQQVRFKRNVLGRHGSLPIIIAPKAESRHGDVFSVFQREGASALPSVWGGTRLTRQTVPKTVPPLRGIWCDLVRKLGRQGSRI